MMQQKAQLTPMPSLSSCSDSSLCETLDLLFEHSQHLHTLIIPIIRKTTYPSYSALVSAIQVELLHITEDSGMKSDDAQDRHTALYGILASHPRLGEKKGVPLSAQSQAEQASLQGANEDQGEALQQLRKLNTDYETRFPGLRYVVFVNGRDMEEITADMRRRIDEGDQKAEERRAIEAMCQIAVDRASKLAQQ